MSRARQVLHGVGMAAGIFVVLAITVFNSYFPVMVFERAQNIRLHNDYADVEIIAMKIRDCDPLLPLVEGTRGTDEPLFRASIRGKSGRWRTTLVAFLDGALQTASKIPSFNLQDYGTWRIYFPAGMVKPPLTAKLELIHMCGPGRDIPVRTTMTFDVH